MQNREVLIASFIGVFILGAIGGWLASYHLSTASAKNGGAAGVVMASQALQRNDLAGARQNALRALCHDPNAYAAHILLGEIAEREGNVPGALAGYEDSLRIIDSVNPEDLGLAGDQSTVDADRRIVREKVAKLRTR